MVLKERGPPTHYREIDRWEDGVGWLAHPEERMARASHCLAVDGAVWVVDPVDAPGIDDLFAEFGDVAGVVVTMDRHGRDAETVARRHDVPIHLPWFVDRSFDPPVEPVRGTLGDTDFRLLRVVDLPGWTEGALYDGETLVVGDALGSADYFVAPGERVGVHPMLRFFPPAALRGLAPERILVGHGVGVTEDATAALSHALSHARPNAPRVWLKGLRAMIPW